MTNVKSNDKASLVILKDLVVFPEMVVSIIVERKSSVNSILDQYANNPNNLNIISVLQKNEHIEIQDGAITLEDVYAIATMVKILQVVKISDSEIKILAKGIVRVQINSIDNSNEALSCNYNILEDKKTYLEESLEALKEDLFSNLTNYATLSKKISPHMLNAIKKLTDVNEIIDSIATQMLIKNQDKQHILEQEDLLERIAYVNSLLEVELDLIEVEKNIRERVKKQMEKNQKDYYLNEQVKAIQKELNNGEEVKEETKELLEKAKKLKLSKEAKEKVEAEIKKLSMMNPISAEASVVRNYVEWLLNVPWNVLYDIKIDLNKAEKNLEEEHYALGKIKDRILEYLAVLKKSKDLKAPILCLVGPPGVGKTSLAKSIAKASGREFVRISLGGVRDEAEIRGHRRTYIGAMPGKIIQAMKKVKVSNPLILLDEIDKMGSDFRGDPSSALLEVLDKEQNFNFIDHYLEVEYDLSNVMFITTANSLNIQEALLDRMEVVELSGYSEEDKLEIAKRHVLPRKQKEVAVNDEEFNITDEALLKVIRDYTRESGVRDLDRNLATITRRVAKELVQTKIKKVSVDENNLVDYAGSSKFGYKDSIKEDLVGVTTGLAWSRVGGDILYIEALKMPGKGDLKLTGKLGDVMQESVKAAYSLLQSNADSLNLDPKIFKEYDIHIHVPEGATPKDGPSAGIAMVTTLYSLLSGLKVNSKVAMTGEISLRGQVLPIGGLREKLLAALRFGITTVIIPKGNEKDLIDVPANSLKKLNVIAVNSYMEVLNNAIVGFVAKNNSNKIKKSDKNT
jgi:ATP-dependent Lon protease